MERLKPGFKLCILSLMGVKYIGASFAFLAFYSGVDLQDCFTPIVQTTTIKLIKEI